MAKGPGTVFFFFNDTATTEIYTLSLHDALPIYKRGDQTAIIWEGDDPSQSKHITYRQLHDEVCKMANILRTRDRKSTRLNSSHSQISYAVFCLKKKKNSLDTETHGLAVICQSL